MRTPIILFALLLAAAQPAQATYPTMVGSAVLDTDVVSDTNHTFDLKTGMTNGNLAIIFWGGGGIDSSPNFACPGWSVLEDQIVAFGSGHFGIAAKIVDGTEGATLTCTTDLAETGTSISIEITGINTTTAVEDCNGINGSTAAPDPEDCNPSQWDVEDTLWIAAAYIDGPVTFSAFPSGFTLNQVNGTNVSSGDIAIAMRNETSASVNPPAFTVSSSGNWAAVTLAIRPAIPTGGGGGGAALQRGQLLGVQ